MVSGTKTSQQIKNILVVDNEPPILACIAGTLKADFELMLATSGEEAIARILTLGGLDLLLTDFSLGGEKDGFDVAGAARNKFPSTPIILMSGDSGDTPRIAQTLALPSTRFLQKPFASSDLCPSGGAA